LVHVHFEVHCTSEDNERGIASGHNDPDLSDAGRRQAAELGRRYASRAIAAVYSSDLLRARKTAEIAFGPLGFPITHDARLRECDYGDLNGAPRDTVHGDRVRYVTERYPNGESWEDAAKRTLELLEEIKLRHDGQEIVIVGHSAQHYALDSARTGKSLEEVVAAPWEWKAVWHWEGEF
jgi:broad specificity phosphatase PhoE